MINKMTIWLLLCLIFSCKKDIVNKSLVKELEPFDQIELNDVFDVYLDVDSVFSVEVYGDENYIEHVSYTVNNKILSIENKRKVIWQTPKRNKIVLYIKSPGLSKIKAAGGCNIKTLSPITSKDIGLILTGKASQANLELDCDRFYYWNHFPTGGKLTLSGNTERLDIWNFAIMPVDAKNLTARTATIENSSEGDCEVRVLDKLEYSIKGSGNIHLYGATKEIIEKELSSSGLLIQH